MEEFEATKEVWSDITWYSVMLFVLVGIMLGFGIFNVQIAVCSLIVFLWEIHFIHR